MASHAYNLHCDWNDSESILNSSLTGVLRIGINLQFDLGSTAERMDQFQPVFGHGVRRMSECLQRIDGVEERQLAQLAGSLGRECGICVGCLVDAAPHVLGLLVGGPGLVIRRESVHRSVDVGQTVLHTLHRIL